MRGWWLWRLWWLNESQPCRLVVRRGVIDAQVRGSIMRMTVSLDDDLLAQAELLCADLERSALLKEALQALVQRESAKRLAALGGSEPELKPIPRRRSAASAPWSAPPRG
jgi:hypothetical protein